MLFSGTLYDNLMMANPHATFEHIVRACRMAEIHDMIESLPKGYQTEIGERGVGLSGGQKQRLAIARALIKQPSRTMARTMGSDSIDFIRHRCYLGPSLIPKGIKWPAFPDSRFPVSPSM